MTLIRLKKREQKTLFLLKKINLNLIPMKCKLLLLSFLTLLIGATNDAQVSISGISSGTLEMKDNKVIVLAD
jgi:hypothetical protein